MSNLNVEYKSKVGDKPQKVAGLSEEAFTLALCLTLKKYYL